MKVSEVQSKKDLKEFVNFPKKLYKGCPYFVPPLDSGEIKTLTKHPALEFCTLKLWLARENGKVVGRIAGIVNHKCLLKQAELCKKSKMGLFWIISQIYNSI